MAPTPGSPTSAGRSPRSARHPDLPDAGLRAGTVTTEVATGAARPHPNHGERAGDTTDDGSNAHRP